MATHRTFSALLTATAAKYPKHLALKSPFQPGFTPLTYGDLSRKTVGLSTWLSAYGYERGDLLVSDLPNVSENLILQLACNRIGVTYGMVKDVESMAKIKKVKGSVPGTEDSFLWDVILPVPGVGGDFVSELLEGEQLDNFYNEDEEEGDENVPHGNYNNSNYTNEDLLLHAADAALKMDLSPEDSVCVGVTLCHPFGIGSGIGSAIFSGSSIVLPAVGGIRGCGVPSERAAATLTCLKEHSCTHLFMDTHTLKALPQNESKLPNFKGGAVKIGSGATFLKETQEYGGINLQCVGKESRK